MKVWLDYRLPMPEHLGFNKHINNSEEAIHLLKEGNVKHISFEYDLGAGSEPGSSVAKYIYDGAFLGDIKKITWDTHSRNPLSKRIIVPLMLMAERYWKELEIRRN